MTTEPKQGRLLRLKEVQKRVGLGRSSIYGMVKSGTFPKPMLIGQRAVAWHEDEIQDWILKKLEQRAAVAA